MRAVRTLPASTFCINSRAVFILFVEVCKVLPCSISMSQVNFTV